MNNNYIIYTVTWNRLIKLPVPNQYSIALNTMKVFVNLLWRKVGSLTEWLQSISFNEIELKVLMMSC